MHRLFALIVLVLAQGLGCTSSSPMRAVLAGSASTPSTPTSTLNAAAREVAPAVHPELQKLADRVSEPRIIRVSERVYVAYSYDFANITFIEGDSGIIVIDAGWATDAATEAIEAFRSEISDKPIVALIYSHGHADHVGGGAAFVEAAKAAGGQLKIYAEKSWKEYQLERVAPSSTHFLIRAAAQMGLVLPAGPAGRMPTGGGKLRATALGFRYQPVTNEIDGETMLTISGVRILAKPMPSETGDQLLFWLPDEKVAFAGDIAAGDLPILSTPRNERGRVPTGFIDGTEWLLSLPLDALIAGHGLPTLGNEKAVHSLSAYRDASQFIFDQTIRALNANLSLEEAAQAVQFPPHLAEHPLLQGHYHRLPWVVKGVYTRYGGWFQGDAATLNPLAPSAEAERMIRLAGGADQLLAAAEAAFASGDYAWSAQLAGYLIEGSALRQRAVPLKSDALRAMAYESDSGNQRNYMLTQAFAMSGKIDFARTRRAPKPPELLRMLETKELFRLVGPNLNPALCLDDEITVGFQLTDLGEEHGYTVRRGVGHYRGAMGVRGSNGRSAPRPDVRIALTRETFEALLGNRMTWSNALREGWVRVEGETKTLERFLSFFDGWNVAS
ncbi:MAG: alkyl sulfatase dimerization domain-containing protein [Myxococcota bacterium]